MSANTLTNTQKRLIFRAWHRGTKEMDLLLGSFADKHVPNFDEEACAQFEELLTENDPDLYNWITGREEVPERVHSKIFQLLEEHRYR